ncbi:hypothetical protein [Streptomyces sp. P8-A8]|uniref:hypothetical protein n=1 Tax=unclassified Streptomyces TaxID=2593676 RepID=UPI0036DEF412
MTIRSVAADLGINPETLRNGVRAAGREPAPGTPDARAGTGADPAGGGERRPVQEGPRAGGGTRELGRGLAPPDRQDHAVRRVLTSSTWHRRRTSRTWTSTSPCSVATGRQLPEEAANCPSAASLRRSQRPTGPVRAGRRRRVPRRVRRVR